MIDTVKLTLQQELMEQLKERYSLVIPVVVEEPKRPEMGDLSVPVFSIVKSLGRPLSGVVQEITELIRSSSVSQYIGSINPEGGFINLRLDRLTLAKAIIKTFQSEKSYGSSMVGNGEVIAIDYSSPNIAKPFSIGHLRSTIIGHAIGNCLEKCGYKVIRINHLGDFGTQFGKIIYSYLHFGNKEAVKANPIPELVKLYVEFHERAKDQPDMEEEARKIFKELEQGNKEYHDLWSWFREVSLEDYLKVYQLLRVSFDSYDGEAFYNDKMQPVIDELQEKGLLIEDEGAMIVPLEEGTPPALIQKTDGSTLYITRDLAAFFYRKQVYQANKVLYVVGNEQKLHFQQLAQVIEKMGYPYAKDIIHVNFGLVLQDGKKMSTRKGKIVRLEDVLREAIRLSREYIEEKNPDLAEKELIAEKVGVSAIIFNDLKNYRGNDFEFNLEDSVNFFGQTGPYLQYTSVRIKSIFAEDTFVFDGKIDLNWFGSDDVFDMVKTISFYPGIIQRCVQEYAPSILAKYLLTLATQFNSFYGKEKILVSDRIERHTKLHLCRMIEFVIDDGMRLLGMQIIEKM
ncbi:MAG: arginine--tRNA ligase [Candidatus Izemoplasmatales bacterium]|nr:arginine--tRNA ligase [Candidatus Izemoplasmatales bacterium]MDY0372619.1 arginine--tRNA ligase [Candidatus Izemoplasmatales bacterium]